MNDRIELKNKLESISGVKAIYFQPPSTVKLKYPCIIYNRSGGRTIFSDDYPYLFRTRYLVTVIDKDPDSKIPDIIAKSFQMCIAETPYTADNLNHFPFSLYY